MSALTSRRTFLAATAVMPSALAATAAPALASAETPIQRLFRQGEEVMDRSDAQDLSEEEADALNEERWPIAEAIAAEPATDLRDLAIKVLVNSGEGCFCLDDALTIECAALAGRNFDKLPGCLFEGESSASAERGK